jgi:8-oxo-dGTP pyrophosphatase MutT (NUDIX family)
MERHLTVSGFVVHQGRTALHWHRKVGLWLPAGGHIEANEDPVQAVLREVEEEFAVQAEVLSLGPRVAYAGGPTQIEPPYTILTFPFPDPPHEHIDLVYFLRVLSGYPGTSYDAENPIHWFTAEELAAGSAPRSDGADQIPFPPDVQALGLEAIRLAADVTAGAR